MKLREAMLHADVKQNQLAELMQVKDSTVSRWATGLDLPKDERLNQLAKLLKVEPEFFVQPGSYLALADAAALIEQILLKTSLKPRMVQWILALVLKDKKFLANHKAPLQLLEE